VTSDTERIEKTRAANRAEGLCACGSVPVIGRKCCNSCLMRARISNRLSKNKRKREAFDAYGGPVCVCCKEDEYDFMTIDHINGGGGAHRKEIGNYSIYFWLKKNGYPPGFQVLCFSCNFAKGHFGMCPHERRRQNALVAVG